MSKTTTIAILAAAGLGAWLLFRKGQEAGSSSVPASSDSTSGSSTVGKLGACAAAGASTGSWAVGAACAGGAVVGSLYDAYKRQCEGGAIRGWSTVYGLSPAPGMVGAIFFESVCCGPESSAAEKVKCADKRAWWDRFA